MIRVSGPKIQEVVKAIDGIEINNVIYTYTGKTVGIQATFNTNVDDEEFAKDNLKKHLKQSMGHLRIYIEVI